jgi:hypothetical protein
MGRAASTDDDEAIILFSTLSMCRTESFQLQPGTKLAERGRVGAMALTTYNGFPCVIAIPFSRYLNRRVSSNSKQF